MTSKTAAASRLSLPLVSDEALQQLFDRALAYVEDKGVEMDHAPALARLAERGALVEPGKKLARIPRRIALEALALAPASVRLTEGPIPQSGDAFLGESLAGTTLYADESGLRYHSPTLQDVAHCSQLVSLLKEIAITNYPIPIDVVPGTVNVSAVIEVLRNTTKPLIVVPDGEADVRFVFEAAVAVCGGEEALRSRPILMPLADINSPFRYKHQDIEWLDWAGRYGQPVRLASAAVAGATSPVTPAGQALLMATELTASLLICQLLNPGAPAIPTVMPLLMDMRTGRAIESLESIMTASAVSRYCKRMLKVPVAASTSFSTHYAFDWQGGMQKSFAALVGALSDADILVGAGGVCGLATSPLQLIADDALLALVRRFARGLSFDDQALALDEILATAPGGNFMSRRHTAQHCRDAFSAPLFTSGSDIDQWTTQGHPQILDRARATLQSLAKKLAPRELPAEVSRELDRVLEAAKRHCVPGR